MRNCVFFMIISSQMYIKCPGKLNALWCKFHRCRIHGFQWIMWFCGGMWRQATFVELCEKIRSMKNPLVSAMVYVRSLNTIISVPADALPPYGSRPPAGLVLTWVKWYPIAITDQEIKPSELNSDVILGAMASQITGVSIVYSGADQRKHQSSALLSLVRGNCLHLVTS